MVFRVNEIRMEIRLIYDASVSVRNVVKRASLDSINVKHTKEWSNFIILTLTLPSLLPHSRPVTVLCNIN